MRNGNRVPYEKADTAKSSLMELLDALRDDNAPIKEIEQLVTIIGKLEWWQAKYVR